MDSIRNKILIWFTAFIVAVFAVVGPTNHYFLARKDKISKINENIEKAYRILLHDFSNSELFFRYETINPLFFETGKSKYLDNHNAFMADIRHHLDIIQRASQNENLELSEKIDTLNYKIAFYTTLFDQVVKLVYERGYKDFGTVGQMRSKVHELEEKLPAYSSNILSLRRHEKDYIIRNDSEYVRKLNMVADDLANMLGSDKKIPKNERDYYLQLLQQYRVLFHSMVKFDSRIGIRDNSGLKLELDNQVYEMENSFSSLIAKADMQKEQMFKKLELFQLILSLMIAVISILISFLIIKRITKPLEQLTGFISNTAESNFESKELPEYEKADNEVKQIYQAFNHMLDQLKTREQQRDMAIMALSENEMKYRELADMLPQSIFETDNMGNYTYVNKAWMRRFGYTTDDIKKGLNLIETIISQNTDKIISHPNVEGNECLAVTLTGEKFPALVYSSPIMLQCEKNGNRGIIVDITERKKYIEALKREKAKAEESDRLKSAFLANMSHEIRTPMNAIIGFSDLLSGNDLSEKQRREFIQHIRTSGELLLNLINDIIDIAKIEAGELNIKKVNISIHLILEEVKVTFQELIKRSNKQLDLRLSKSMDDDFIIKTDPFRLKQILTNIIGNSLKFTQKGYIEYGYEFTGEHQILFYVKDTGIGLPPEKKDIVFERFRQVEDGTERSYGGTGLGLAITKNLVEMLGGEIWLDSTPSIGTTFFFTLPYKRLKLDENVKHITYNADQVYDWKDKTILVAEDEITNFEVVKHLLTKNGAKILWAKNGQKAVELTQQYNKQIDIILMDVQMPVMNGYDAIKKIKVDFPEIPIIAQTAYAFGSERAKSRKAGSDDYISKPISKNLLYSKLDFLMNKSIINDGNVKNFQNSSEI